LLPSAQPILEPTDQPSSQPTKEPSSLPSEQPTTQPSSQKTIQPSSSPIEQPIVEPSSPPTTEPTDQPSWQPYLRPTLLPTRQPTIGPNSRPSHQPSRQPSSKPSKQPSNQPHALPSTQPHEQIPISLPQNNNNDSNNKNNDKTFFYKVALVPIAGTAFLTWSLYQCYGKKKTAVSEETLARYSLDKKMQFLHLLRPKASKVRPITFEDKESFLQEKINISIDNSDSKSEHSSITISDLFPDLWLNDFYFENDDSTHNNEQEMSASFIRGLDQLSDQESKVSDKDDIFERSHHSSKVSNRSDSDASIEINSLAENTILTNLKKHEPIWYRRIIRTASGQF
jgi:hypothetical protein